MAGRPRPRRPHPGAQLTFTDGDDHPLPGLHHRPRRCDEDVAYLEALQRGRGRAEKRICDLKDTGLTNLPSASFAINHAWMTLALVAHDLLAWTRSFVIAPLAVDQWGRLLRH